MVTPRFLNYFRNKKLPSTWLIETNWKGKDDPQITDEDVEKCAFRKKLYGSEKFREKPKNKKTGAVRTDEPNAELASEENEGVM